MDSETGKRRRYSTLDHPRHRGPKLETGGTTWEVPRRTVSTRVDPTLVFTATANRYTLLQRVCDPGIDPGGETRYDGEEGDQEETY